MVRCSSFTLFPTSGVVYVWISPKEAYNPACLVPTVKHGARFDDDSAGPVLALNGQITAGDTWTF